SDFYHAGLTHEDRNRKQDEWINNKIRVIVCTNAFGMGINKPDVRAVIHYDVPDALENYYQEAGRAGRDGNKSYAVLLYNDTEINDLKKQADIRFPLKEMIRKVYGALCNYLQLASGTGEGLSFDFDINTFVKNFKLEAFVVNNVLKILEQEELISYSEQFFSPSTVGFTISKKDLEIFEDTYPEYTDLIKGLLRSYEGIFDFSVSINENKLSRFISIPPQKLFELFRELDGRGIISYIPQKEKPQILFLQNRINANDLIINEKNITKRKRAFEERLNAMIAFVENKTRCRSQMIGAYFNDNKLARCGVCDNCINLKKTTISDEEFHSISLEIKKTVAQDPLDLTSLKNQLSAFKQTQILKVLDFLQDENIVTVSQEGLISLNGKKKGPR
ncbi:MAG: helicase-related protein, partial [Ginsengibacter sp.]